MVKYVAIGPGAMGYFAFLGAISSLKQHGRLDDLEEISGSSAGALLAFVFALAKGDTTKVLDYTLTVNTKQIMKPNIRNFLKNYGLVSSSKLRQVFSGTIKYFTGRDDMSFKDLYEWYPIKIHVASYCLDALKTVYFSVDSSPTMSILDAISASVAIPFIISSVKLNDGWNYIDGGYAESTPAGAFLGRPREDVLILALEWKLVSDIKKDLKSYAVGMLIANMKLRYDYDYPTIFIKTDVNVFDFGGDQEAKLRLFMDGLAAH